MSPLVPLLLAAWTASAESAAPPPLVAGASRPCPPDWETKFKGGCWIMTHLFGEDAWAYVHPRGWVVDRRCLEDGRFTPPQFLAAMDDAYGKMSPTAPLSRGGCLSAYNPVWARSLHDAPWRRRMHVACGPYDAESRICASHEKRDGFRRLSDGRVERLLSYFRLITIKNARACMGATATGLSGIIFHETLHGDDVDNFSTEEHNEAWNLPQYRFVYDHVYGAEAVCYYGMEKEKVRYANFLQCLFLTRQAGQEEKRELCRLFPSSYTDTPAGFLKH